MFERIFIALHFLASLALISCNGNHTKTGNQTETQPMITVKQLHEQINELTAGYEARKEYFDESGVLVSENQEAWKSDETPLNTTVFAHTGGDFVHYSILIIDSTLRPVVMTIPINSGGVQNLILSETLAEFLGLGYEHGWFPLEQIVYQSTGHCEESIFDYYAEEFHEKEEDVEIMAHQLRKRLKFARVPLRRERLLELNRKYLSQLKFKNAQAADFEEIQKLLQ
jgi:hypothetical protein